MKLNLGCGDFKLPGYENWDITNGHAAYPLEVPDESVEEIRASHVLEHLSQKDSIHAVKNWVEKLRPGGLLKVAVPDADQVFKLGLDDPLHEAYLFGGQSNEHDYHKSVWTERKLTKVFRTFGMNDPEPWTSELEDCASYPFSLNMMATKPEAPTKVEDLQELKVKAVMSVPRYGQMAARGIMDRALKSFNLPLHTTQGVYWGQCMDRAFQTCIDDGVDWILTIDFDSVFTKHHLNTLFHRLGQNPHIDALAALQVRRGGTSPLFTMGDVTKVELDCERLDPLRVITAHFGLTLIRVERLKEVPRPWFHCIPGKDGGWEPESGKVDGDITFWQKWSRAYNSVYVDPQVRIGHVEELACWYDDDFNLQTTSVDEWRNRFEGDERHSQEVQSAGKVQD